jgi:acyl-CoA thioester hydrolase
MLDQVDVARARVRSGAMNIDPRLSHWSETARPEWTDYNGHMNVAYYVLVFDHATDAFHASIGIDAAYRAAGRSTFAVEQHFAYLREVRAGARLACATRLVEFDDKRVRLFTEMFDADAGHLAATGEMLAVHVDLAARRAAPVTAEIRDRLARVLESHRGLPRPAQLGRAIALPAKA